jgi:hypothetical protein
LTRPGLASARLTVDIATPASRATSAINAPDGSSPTTSLFLFMFISVSRMLRFATLRQAAIYSKRLPKTACLKNRLGYYLVMANDCHFLMR